MIKIPLMDLCLDWTGGWQWEGRGFGAGPSPASPCPSLLCCPAGSAAGPCCWPGSAACMGSGECCTPAAGCSPVSSRGLWLMGCLLVSLYRCSVVKNLIHKVVVFVFQGRGEGCEVLLSFRFLNKQQLTRNELLVVNAQLFSRQSRHLGFNDMMPVSLANVLIILPVASHAYFSKWLIMVFA